MRRKAALLVASITTLLCLGMAPPASALQITPLVAGVGSGTNVFKGINCNDKQNAQSAVCKDQVTNDKNPLTGQGGVLLKVVQLIALFAGVAAVIIIVVSGMKFIFSQGDSAKTNEARNTLLYALVGLIIIVLAFSIISFVISKT